MSNKMAKIGSTSSCKTCSTEIAATTVIILNVKYQMRWMNWIYSNAEGVANLFFPWLWRIALVKYFFFVFWSTILSRAQECVHFLMEQFTEEEEGWWAEIVLNTQLTIYRTQKHLKEYKQCQTAQGRKVKSV